MTRALTSLFRFLFRRPQVEGDLTAELQYHLDRQIDENLRHGITPEEARRQAILLIGGIEPLKDDCRDVKLGRTLETIWQDVRYGTRVLLKNPGFSLAAVVTLALGIGANTAIFSIVYGVLLRPLPYSQGSQLVVLHQNAPKARVFDAPFSVKEIEDYRVQSHTLQGVVEHHTMNFLLIGKDTAERVETAVVSANFFDVLGVTPLLGRAFVAGDEAHGADAVLILTYKYWQSHQSADPNIIGKIFQMNNRPHTVIGVLPPIPQYPSEVDVYMPTSQCPVRSSAGFIADRQQRMMTAFGRLKPGVKLAQAQADLSVVGQNMATANPAAYPAQMGYSLDAAPLQDDLTRRARAMFLVLLGVSAFVLLIACANIANLLLARLLRLEGELALRAALGASKARLVRQMLTESVLLSVAGGALGLILAPSALALLTKFAARFTTRAAEVHIDGPVLLFTLLISVFTGLVFGMAPALSSGAGISRGLGSGLRTTASHGRRLLRSGLVVSQVAVSVILLAGAGLMIRSFVKLQHVDPGFSPDRLLTLRISPGFPPYNFNTIRKTLGDRILARMKTIGAVESFAMASSFPFNPAGIVNGPQPNDYEIDGQPLSKGDVKPRVDIRVVSAGYFETIRQPVVQGRSFTEHDDDSAPAVAIINQTMARHRFPNENPIGKRISFDHRDTWAEIVGVAGDVKEYGLDQTPGDEIYLSYRRGFVSRLIVRTAQDPDAVAPSIRSALHEIDPLVALDKIDTVERAEQDSMASPRVMTFLLGIFAGLAVLISASGIAAAMALSVSERTHEIGVRLALGAKSSSVVSMVIRQGLLMTLAGIALGIAGAAALTNLLGSFLFGTSPTDFVTFAGVSLLFLIVASVACFIPARQVTSIDPLNALRQE